MSAFAFTLLFGPGPVPLPAPPEVVDAVQEIDVDSTVDEASVFHLRLAIAQTALGDWTLLDKDFFRPLAPVSIRITNGLGFPETLINGYVSRQEVNYSIEPGASIQNIQRWPNQPDGLIAAAIFGKYAVLPRVQQTFPQFVEPQGTSTQRRTDIRFLRWMAERNGFECYVQPEPLTGIDMGFFRPPQLSGPPSAVLNVNLGPETNVVDFSIGYEMAAPTSVVASSIDVFTKSVQQARGAAAAEVPLGTEPALQRVLSMPVVRPAGTGLMRTAELQALAQAITDRSSFAITAQGTVGLSAGILRPGSLVNVRGVGRLFNGAYYITRVSHNITRAGYTQRFQGRRNAVTMTGTELYAGI